MKVSKIYIKDHNQFKGFELDLTYPKGHQNAGLPLDKVCFIGQSGTGKTSLLLFLKRAIDFLGQLQRAEKIGVYWDEFLLGINSEFKISFEEKTDKLLFSSPKKYMLPFGFSTHHPVTGQESTTILSLSNEQTDKIFNGPRRSPVESRYVWVQEIAHAFLKNNKIGYLYYPVDLSNTYNPPEKLQDTTDTGISGFRGIDLSWDNAQKHWEKILKDILKYQETEIQQRIKLSKIVEDRNISQEELEKAREEFDIWLRNSINPVQKLGDKFLDAILKKFNLRVKRELNFGSKEDIGFIKVENLQGIEVPLDFWSTGTKHLIFSLLPLYALSPENEFILFDEPERSLYPDIQTEIINILTSKELSTDCQFFFATHSPLIASSFEPWEVVELKFKDDGSVYRELYYEGENHVDNYTINPQLLRWDGILQRVFDLDKASNPKRNEALSQLARLKKTLERNSLTPDERAVKWKEYSDLAEKLNWDIEELDTPKADAKN